MSTDTTRTDHTALPFIGGVVLAVPCRVPQSIQWKKFSKEVFPRHEALCDPSGRADAADCCRGAPIEVRTVNRARGANSHT